MLVLRYLVLMSHFEDALDAAVLMKVDFRFEMYQRLNHLLNPYFHIEMVIFKISAFRRFQNKPIFLPYVFLCLDRHLRVVFFGGKTIRK